MRALAWTQRAWANGETPPAHQAAQHGAPRGAAVSRSSACEPERRQANHPLSRRWDAASLAVGRRHLGQIPP
eukprot:6836073-Prymnesium_polylepis.2